MRIEKQNLNRIFSTCNHALQNRKYHGTLEQDIVKRDVDFLKYTDI